VEPVAVLEQPGNRAAEDHHADHDREGREVGDSPAGSSGHLQAADPAEREGARAARSVVGSRRWSVVQNMARPACTSVRMSIGGDAAGRDAGRTAGPGDAGVGFEYC
jgi:hypothetical protein